MKLFKLLAVSFSFAPALALASVDGSIDINITNKETLTRLTCKIAPAVNGHVDSKITVDDSAPCEVWPHRNTKKKLFHKSAQLLFPASKAQQASGFQCVATTGYDYPDTCGTFAIGQRSVVTSSTVGCGADSSPAARCVAIKACADAAVKFVSRPGRRRFDTNVAAVASWNHIKDASERTDTEVGTAFQDILKDEGCVQ